MLSLRYPSARTPGLRSFLENGFFSDFFEPEAVPGAEARHAVRPAVDLHELKDKFVLKVDLPGVEEKDIRVELNDGTLLVEGARSAEKTEQEHLVHLHERSSIKFRRTFAIGDGVDAAKIKADYRNGTLTIDLPKAERAQPRPIPITVNKQ